MLSGRRLDLLDPSPLDVEIEDIAHGLARVARWNGQTSGDHIYSVAQHSLLVEAIARDVAALTPPEQLAILLHDAAEYVVGDLISPFKAVLGGSYKEVEKRILAAVMLRFGLPPTLDRRISAITKQADTIAAHHEAVLLAGFTEAEAARFFGEHRPLSRLLRETYLTPWQAETAKMRFLERFSALAHGL
jgi:5'-deoxynucleotidase YfbR-like HD superfamily hydrolase